MKFFPQLMRLLAAALAASAVEYAPKLIAFFQGAAPSDVSPMIWTVVGIVAVFAINFFVGKIPHPPEAP